MGSDFAQVNTEASLGHAAGEQGNSYGAANAADGIIWAGEAWSFGVDGGRGHKLPGVASGGSENVEVKDGIAVVVVGDSEAVVVDFVVAAADTY